jgi:hypothetical protein
VRLRYCHCYRINFNQHSGPRKLIDFQERV